MAKATPLAPPPTRASQPTPAATGLPELPSPQVYVTLNSRPSGLTEAEVNALADRFGPNTIQAVRGVPLWVKFLNNFTHLMALLLWAGGIIGFLAQLPQIAIAIWLVNLINGLFSFGQEYRAERATAALRQMLPAYARVRREGEETRVRVEAVVPGDVLLLAEGDRICADARLVEEAELWVDQSTFTGESHPIHKASYPCHKNGLADTELPNLVFAGTNVVSGTGVAVVFATAMATRFGNIAHLTQSMTEEPSPLQKELGRVTRLVSALAVIIGLVFFGLAVGLAQVSLAESFIFAMGMIVAFVPEGMLPTVTLSLALGVQRMARRHALVKKLSAVETLGCTTVICTDKTGTLTQNEMTVVSLWLNGQKLRVSGVGYAPQGQILAEDKAQPVPMQPGGDLHELLRAAALCNDAKVIPPASASSPEERGNAKEGENGAGRCWATPPKRPCGWSRSRPG